MSERNSKILFNKWHVSTHNNDNVLLPNGDTRLVDYVVLAEFDIATGSTVRLQYPEEIPGFKPDWLAENMLPEGAHNRENDYTYMFLNRSSIHVNEKFWISPSCKSVDVEGSASDKRFLYGLNHVHTKHDESARRGAIVKAIAVFSKFSFIEILKRPIEVALQEYYITKSVKVFEKLYKDVNSYDIFNIPVCTSLEKLLMRRGVSYKPIGYLTPSHTPDMWNFDVNLSLDFAGCRGADGGGGTYSIKASIPLYRTPDEVGDISVLDLVRVLGGTGVMKVYNGLLTGQRTLFVGYNHSAHDVCKAVLSSVAMVAPPMHNIIRRVYPYGFLQDTDFLTVPGYVAGVTNPIFQTRYAWWDIICTLDLPNGVGSVYTAEEKRQEDSGGILRRERSGHRDGGDGAGAPHPDGDAEEAMARRLIDETASQAMDDRFIEGVVSCITTGTATEQWIRQRFYDYTASVLAQAQDPPLHSPYDLAGDGLVQIQDSFRREYEGNAFRVEALRKGAEFPLVPTNPWEWLDLETAAAAAASSSPAVETGVCSSVRSISAEIVSYNSDEGESVTGVISSMIEELLLRAMAGEEEGGCALAPTPSSGSAGLSPLSPSSSPAHCTMFPGARSRLRTHIRRLQCEANLHPVLDAQDIFADISAALECTPGEPVAQALLSLLPESQGGLLILSSGLFHGNPSVRMFAVRILQSLEQFESTRVVCDSLSLMVRSAYKRQRAKMADGSLQTEAEAYDRRYQSQVDAEAAAAAAFSGSPGGPHDSAGAEHRNFSFFSRGSSAAKSAKPTSYATIGEQIELIH